MTTPATPAPLPHNRLGLDYRDPPPRSVLIPGGIIDAHNHTREVQYTQTFVDAAAAYGITEFWTMCGLEHAPFLTQKWPGQFHFVAIPAWQNAGPTEEFTTDWLKRVDQFYELGARLIKFHLAPGTKKKWGITADHPMIQRVAKHAYSLGYHMMTHVGDPKAWFCGKGRYADGSIGTFDSQFEGAERLLEAYPDRVHLGAHMGGSLEDLDALAKRLDKYPNYILDTSATKWIVRAIAEPCTPLPNAMRDFFLAYQDRILFGSDLVVGDKFTWDHYASRFWAHQKLWETNYLGESPIEDPDAGQGFDARTGTWNPAKADGIPRLVGLNLPPEVLQKLYRKNAERWLPRA